MAQNVRLSRLNPVYLAKRHAGAFLLVLALGLAAGLVVQAVFMPRKYWSAYSRSFFITPPSSAANLDWNGKNREWSALTANASTRTLLTANLRSGMKRLLAGHLRPFDASPERLRTELLAFRAPQVLSTAPGSGPIRARLGPKVEIARHDLAANLDFQALALVVADLDPRSDAADWDFSGSMAELVDIAPTAWIIARPGPNDPFFKVFYRLHAILNQGAVADSPAEAWQTAVAEVGARLVRETEFQGGGGFGPVARGEILLEIGSLPVLVANSLYGAAEAVFSDDTDARQEAQFWEQKWLRDASVRIEHDGAARGRLDIEMRSDLHFLSFPFDSPFTRIAPLAVRTLYAYIEAWERNAEAPPAAPEPPPPPPEPEIPAEPEPRAETTIELIEPAEPVPGPDSSKIRDLEAALHQARIDRDGVGRRLEAARMALEGLAGEAGSAREHADRLKERLEAAELQITETVEPEPDPNLVVLLDEREFLLRRLAELLQYCTDQHPFVIQIRRQLAALEGRIALFAIETPDRAANERRARLANLRGEWNAADANARGLAERRRRLQIDADRILEELALAERRYADAEFALNAERAKAIPVVRDSTQELSKNIGLLALQLTSIAKDSSAEAKVVETKQEPAAPQMTAAPARISFSTLPALFPLAREPSSGWPIYLGAALGLCLGLVWVALRESFTFRLPNAYTAKRLVDLPLLAVLPAYEPKSLAAAAAAVEGAGLVERGGRNAYMPPSIDHNEPPPIGKRRPIRLERKRRRIATWILAGAVVLLALAAHQAVSRGWLNPASPFTAEVWRESPARNIVSRSSPPAEAEAVGEYESREEP